MTVVEQYANTLYHYDPTVVCSRYWVKGFPILIGGSLLSSEDWDHLRQDYLITDCINVETEHDDVGKVLPRNLIQAQFPDDGAAISPLKVLSICLFVQKKLWASPSSRFYVHCQMGGSRSPSVAYALLRGIWNMTPEMALQIVSSSRDGGWGNHVVHEGYMRSVDAALLPILGEE